MRLPKRGEKGFTLIELLIVVAILGVLAAIVIPNVGRFIGRGEEEAAATEFTNVQAAVVAMMTDNRVDRLPTGTFTLVGDATDNMSNFPSDAACNTTGEKISGPVQDGTTALYTTNDKDGYVLYRHDIYADNSATADLVNYTATEMTKGTYYVDSMGTVYRTLTGYE